MPDNNFFDFINLFYRNIYEHEYLHRYCINGDIQVCTYDLTKSNWNFQELKSEIKWYQIPIDVTFQEWFKNCKKPDFNDLTNIRYDFNI